MNSLKILLPFGLAVLASGCTVGPDNHSPVAKVPAHWGSHGQTGPAQRPVAGWSAFGDSELNALEHRAVEANLDLQLAAARVVEARAARGFATAQELPHAAADGAAQRERISPHSPLGPLIPEPNTSDFAAGFEAGWEIDLFGRVRRGVEAADADVAATEEMRRGVLVSVIAEVARTYVDLRASQRRLAIAEAKLASDRSTLSLVKERNRAGLAPDFDVARATAETEDSQAELPLLRRASAEAIYQLSVLLGEEPRSLADELSGPQSIPTPPTQFAAGVPSDLLRQRPDILEADRRLAAANARIGVAEADYFPRFDLKAALGLESTDLTHLGELHSAEYAVGPAFGWSLFDGGRIRANVRVHDAERDEAELRYRQVVLDALREVETALLRYDTESERGASLAAAEIASRRALGLAEERYRQGAIDLLGVLDAQRVLFAVEDRRAQNAQASATDYVALLKALGSGV